MAGTGTTSSKKSGGPLPGPFMEFELPIRPDAKVEDKKQKNEILLCKECVGVLLKLKPAHSRVGVFGGNNKDTKGKKFALGTRKGNKPYTLILKAATKVKCQGVNDTAPKERTVKSIQISAPNGVTVAEMKEFCQTSLKDIVHAIITPSGKKHTLKGPLGTTVLAAETKTA
jgi:hypothetical protein